MLLNDLIEGLKDMFFTFLYTCFRCICQLIDFIKKIFYMLFGIEPVEIDGTKGDMLTSLIQSDSAKKAFLTVSLIGVILLVLFTGIAILKANYQEKQSWASILKKSGQSLLITLLIPLIMSQFWRWTIALLKGGKNMASLESELRLPREMNVKPNYSALSQKFKMDRHTIKKKMEGQRRGGLLVFQEREGRHLLLLEFQTFREEERLRGAGWGA